MLGQRLSGRYELVAEVGRGGMGVVYRATDSALSREVAVKVLPPSFQSDDIPLRFKREATTMAKLQHTNIVAVHDVGEDGDLPYFVMELVQGPSLHAFCATSDMKRLCDTGIQVCQALGYAHDRGVIHRDIKPSNVLLTPLGVAKLADFGLARVLDVENISRSGAFIGTTAYVSPEQALAERVDGRSDLYSLGVLLYELITGRLPFTGETAFSIVFQHLHATPVSPRVYNPTATPALVQIILKLLSKDPAQRYQSAAELVEVLEAVRGGLDAAVSVAPLGEAPKETSASSLLSAIGRANMVGREPERARLQQSVDQCATGTGGGVIVRGEAGIGKTRLIREVSVYARLKSFRVLTGECEAGEQIPYKPFVEAILQYLRLAPQDDAQPVVTEPIAAEIIKLSPAIGRLLPDVAPSQPLEPRQERLRLFESVTQLMQRIADRDAPVLLVVEDLHWADEPTLALLHHLSRQWSGMRLVTLGSYRDTDVVANSPVERVLLDMNRERSSYEIPLYGLTGSQVRSLLIDLLEDQVQEDFSQAIYQRTQGNAFFIEEVLRHLVESGVLYRSKGQWQIADVAQVELPDTVQAAVSQRLQRLKPETQQLLTTASVLGQEFSVEVLEKVTQTPFLTLLDLLDECVAAKLVGERKEAQRVVYHFRHAAVREALYESLSLGRRTLLHGRVGSALEEAASGREQEFYGVLASHFSRSDHADKAAFYLMKAGEEAQRLCDNQAALRFLRDSLAILNQLPLTPQFQEWRVQASTNLGEVHFMIGEHAKAEAELKEALTAATAQGLDAETVAMIYFKIADAIHWQERYQEAVDWAEQGWKLVADSPPSQAKACLLDVLSRSYHALGEFDRAASYAFRMAEFARSLDYFEYLYEVYYRIAFWTVSKGETEEALRWFNECLAFCTQRNDQRGIARCLHGIGEVWGRLGDLDRTVESFRQSLEISERIGDAHITVENHMEIARSLAEVGRAGEAIVHAKRGAEIAATMGRQDYLRGLLPVLARLHTQSGDREQAIVCLREAVGLARNEAERQSLLAELEKCHETGGQQENHGQPKERAPQAAVPARQGGDP